MTDLVDRIKSFFSRSMAELPEAPRAEAGAEEIRLAACALLLELAYADDEFTEDERAHVEGAVRRHFGLEEERAAELIGLAEAERRQAVDLWQFTRLIAENYSLGQKMVLAEVMWGLVYADGELASREDYLMRKISNLLGLEAGYLSEARKRADDSLSPPSID